MGIPGDYMHSVLEGVTQWLLCAWFNTENHREPYYLGRSVHQVDNLLYIEAVTSIWVQSASQIYLATCNVLEGFWVPQLAAFLFLAISTLKTKRLLGSGWGKFLLDITHLWVFSFLNLQTSKDSTVHTQFEGGSGVQSGMGWNGMRKTLTEHYTLTHCMSRLRLCLSLKLDLSTDVPGCVIWS